MDNGDQTIPDNATGLMWAKSDSGVGMNWQDALAWTQIQNTTNYLGHDGCTFYDVHGAGAQRSDPKTGSGLVTMGAARNGGAPYGLGPQGDAQRVNDFVRLVRDNSSAQTTYSVYLPLLVPNSQDSAITAKN